ncbi:MAG: DUF2892 domain-containing protein [Candidatus Saccharimonadales bacterium]
MNESTTDRITRIVLGIILILTGWLIFSNDTIGIILDVLGAIALVTGITGFCMLYKVFGINTKK